MNEGDVVASRFVVEWLAGVGGMGSVYRALDRTSGETVALKVITPTPEGQEYAARLAREGEALARLSHPRIVRYVAHGMLPNRAPYVALEWIEGNTLSRRLKGEGLTLPDTVEVLAQVADALGYAHAHGVVHRDVKPGNVMLRGAGSIDCVLLDFGVARLSTEPSDLTRTGMLVGTPSYMAPEQARGAREIDARADVFALGCLAFKCLTGKAAFAASDGLAVLAKLLLDEPPRLRDARPEVPLTLDVVVGKMLERDKDKRYPDGAAAAAALRALGTLEDPTHATVTFSSAATSALTAHEQRLMSLVVIGARQDGLPAGSRLRKVEEAVRELGAKCEAMASGVIVVGVTGAGSATDLAASGARAALRARSALGEVPIVVVTGRGSSSATASHTSSMGGGDVYNRASQTLRKLGDTGAVDGVLLDDATARLLDARFDIKPDLLGPLLRREIADAEPRRLLMGKETPCVGREPELALLEATLAECVDDSVARAVVVTAPSGVGKSRLRYEFLRRARSEYPEALTLVGQGDPLLTTGPYAILARAIRRAAGIRDGDPADISASNMRLLAGRVAHDKVDETATFLGEMFGVPVARAGDPAVESARRDPSVMASRTKHAFERWLEAECRERPVFIVLDDMQWGDGATARLLDSTLATLHDRPLFVMALGRPELVNAFPSLWVERGAQPVPLTPLTRRASERLARQVLGEGAANETVERVAKLAEGNAFFLEELLRTAASGVVDVPDSVRAMVQARLEALEPEARRVLRAASIFGDAFWAAGVRALVGEAAVPVDAWLKTLTDREIVTARPDSRLAGQSELAFRHAMVREAAYAMLTDEDRSLGHKLAAQWLAGAGERDALALAEHFERGDEPVLATPWLVRAAEAALEKYEFTLVTALAERAAAVGADDASRGAMLVFQADAHRWRGETALACEAARRAMELVPPHSELWLRAVSLSAISSSYRGDSVGVEEAAAMLKGHLARGDEATRRRASIASAEAAYSLCVGGRKAAALDLLAAATAHAGPLVEHDPIVAARILSVRRTLAVIEGNPFEILTLTERDHDASARAGDLRAALMAYINSGYALGLLGRWEESVQRLREGVAQAESLGFATTAMQAKQNLGYSLLRLGQLDEAERLEREVAVEAEKQAAIRYRGWSRTCLSSIALARRDPETAVREARAAVEATQSHAYALAILAEAELARGDVGAALACSLEAVAKVEASGAFDVRQSLVRVVHVDVLFAAGADAEARALLVTAHRDVLARALLVPEGDARARYLHAVPEHARILALAAQHGL